MSVRGALLAFRIQKFETVIVGGAAILSVVVSAIVIALANPTGFSACLAGDTPELSTVCQSTTVIWLGRVARMSLSIVPIFPVIAGLLAGSPIVARELEAGTARLAWSLSPSRLRWFVQRAAPILVMTVLACLAIGLTADALLRLTNPAMDLDHSFVGFRFRGPLVAVEGFVIASIALAAGAVLGRIVPTIIVTLIVLWGLLIGFDKVERSVLVNEAVLADSQSYMWSDQNLFLDSRLRFPDGQVLTYEEAVVVHPEIERGWEGDRPPWEDLVLYIPGSRYHEIELREAVAFGGLATAFVGLGALVVVRRRPR